VDDSDFGQHSALLQQQSHAQDLRGLDVLQKILSRESKSELELNFDQLMGKRIKNPVSQGIKLKLH
jgi:hypothetical protein